MPIPQKTFFLVERASCPFQNLIKRTFARGLIKAPPNLSVGSMLQI
ncbi:hypothetical protein QUB70_21095 [Microcoleus sp. A003_D6]